MGRSPRCRSARRGGLPRAWYCVKKKCSRRKCSTEGARRAQRQSPVTPSAPSPRHAAVLGLERHEQRVVFEPHRVATERAVRVVRHEPGRITQQRQLVRNDAREVHGGGGRGVRAGLVNEQWTAGERREHW